MNMATTLLIRSLDVPPPTSQSMGQPIAQKNNEMTTAKQKSQLQHSIHPSHFGTEFRSEWPPAGSSSQQKTSEKHLKTHKAPTTQTAMIRFEDFQHPTCSAKEHGVSGVFAHGSVCSTFHHCPNDKIDTITEVR